MQYLKERKQVLDVAQKIYREKMVPGTWGNVSLRVKGQPLLLITPSGMAYESMTIDDIVLLDLEGEVVEGGRVPSIEKHLHAQVYKKRPDVGAVIHVHTIHASAFAVAGKSIPVILEETAQVIGHAVQVAAYAPCGTDRLAAETVDQLGAGNAVLLANHGLVGVGQDLPQALRVCQIAEKTAQVALLAASLGQVNELCAEDINILNKQFKDYGQNKK
ncbi:MAG TPA: class II aldolase/adducin family protein [Syntrophomonas sp.]|nr:class II aldolase/adducin family protein [Syntrophomonas sp.]HRW11748.1 class II aldolase/adducin family protein [Syntrophomonas sp.]